MSSENWPCEESLVAEIQGRLRQAGLLAPVGGEAELAGACSVAAYRQHVVEGAWQESWLDEAGSAAPRMVRGQVWTSAIQTALDEHLAVHIPYRAEPYYIDAPLVLRSGQRLLVDPRAELRLVPGTNTCILRNQNPFSGQDGPVPAQTRPDTDIFISGGIWSTLATSRQESNGNVRGRVDQADSCPGAHGTILLHNVERVVVRGVTIRQCRPFGFQMGNCSDFLLEDIHFEDQRRDGVHLEGPARYGLIRRLSGVTGDDMVALNAWDWRQYSVTFGAISHVLVEGLQGSAYRAPAETANPYVPDGSAEVRLLAGTKRFPSGQVVNCDIHDCVFRDLGNVRTFKIYDQPNLELGRDVDYAEPIGALSGLVFAGLRIPVPTAEATFQVAANVVGLTIAMCASALICAWPRPTGWYTSDRCLPSTSATPMIPAPGWSCSRPIRTARSTSSASPGYALGARQEPRCWPTPAAWSRWPGSGPIRTIRGPRPRAAWV